MSDRVVINVGGQHFESTKSTLVQSSYFEALLNRWVSQEEIFLDRSPHIFKHVLGLLRDPSYPYPAKYRFELDFYGIEAPAGQDPLSIINQNLLRIHKLLDNLDTFFRT